MIRIVEITQENLNYAAPLVAAFRVALKSYKGIETSPDLAQGKEELAEYLAAGFPTFAALCGGEFAGYAVCRIDVPCVWVESVFVKPEYRRRGVATALLKKAEEIAEANGEDTVFNYVHPNNHDMISFLQSHGYTVLNLIEIRKPFRGETLTQRISVGEHSFDY